MAGLRACCVIGVHLLVNSSASSCPDNSSASSCPEGKFESASLLQFSSTELSETGKLTTQRDALALEVKKGSSVTDKMPMVHVFGEGVVSQVVQEHRKWYKEHSGEVDTFVGADHSWKHWEYLGPITKICPAGELRSFGRGDEEKKVCSLGVVTEVSGACNIISLGSNGQWGFETEVFKTTDCTVHTFDCTGNFPAPREIESRVHSYKKCIGGTDSGRPKYLTSKQTLKRGGDTSRANFLTYDKILELAGLVKAPTYLKMDIEGYEFEVLPEMLSSSARMLLPEQIQMEIHSFSAEAVSNFGDMMFRAGYVIIDRRDNLIAPVGWCTEVLFARVAQHHT